MNTSKKDLEETLRTAARSLLLDHGTSVTDILNVIRSEAVRASTSLPPRHVFYTSGYDRHSSISPYIDLFDLKNRADEDLFRVIQDITDHFIYEKTKEGNLVISNRFKEYYIAEVLQTDDENSAPLNQGWQTHRKRRRDDPIPPFANSKEKDKDLPPIELRHNNEKHKNYPERGSRELAPLHKATITHPDNIRAFTVEISQIQQMRRKADENKQKGTSTVFRPLRIPNAHHRHWLNSSTEHSVQSIPSRRKNHPNKTKKTPNE
ncbi:hypothetical protein HK104_001164 [Borealophlyctis nickersoniae]|nr:hypothetical protein HK104_001164 [Borealophlyctis nickersoniae]